MATQGLFDNTGDPGINRQQSNARFILRNLTDIFNTKEIYLAGGMVRDWHFGNTGTDYDIYIPMPGPIDKEFILPMVIGTELFTNIEEKKVEIGPGYTGTPYADLAIETIIECQFSSSFFPEIGGEPVQLIFIQDGLPPRYYIEEGFCCSLSKTYMDASGYLAYSKDFVRAVEDKRLDFDFSWAGDVNFDYISKMSKKFPDFEIDKETLKMYRSFLSQKHYWN